MQVRMRRWQQGLSAGGVAAGADAYAAAAAAGASGGTGGEAPPTGRFGRSSFSLAALGGAGGSFNAGAAGYASSDEEDASAAALRAAAGGGLPPSSSSSSALLLMPAAALSAAAAAAAARCVVSARDLALCLDMVADADGGGGAGSPGASDVGRASVTAESGGTPGGGASGLSFSRARSSAADAFAHLDARMRPPSSPPSAAGSIRDDDDEAETHGLSPLIIGSGTSVPAGGSLTPGGGGGAARRALRQRTFRMSDLASDDATMDAATAAALAPPSRAAAAAAAAAVPLGQAAHHHAVNARHLFPRISSSSFLTGGGGGGGPHRRRRRASVSSTVLHYRVAIPARIAAFQSRPGPRAATAALDGVTWQVVMLVCTLYVLFAEDIKVICFPPSTDAAFRGLAIFNFSIFVAELLVRSVVEPDYAFRFYFWLDAGAALSLLPDFVEQSDDLAYGRAGRAARVGARLGRVIRFVRVVQTLRLLALVEMRRGRARRAAAEAARAEAEAAAALGVSLFAFQRAAAASRRPGDGSKSAHADDLEDWPALGSAGGVRASLDGAAAANGHGAPSSYDEESGGAPPLRRASTPRSAAVEARLAAGSGGGPAGLDRASAVWERMNALMSRKLIIGLLAVIIIFPLLEVVRADYSPQLFLHTLESWSYGSGGFNATLDAFLVFGGGAGASARDATVTHAPHAIVYVGACAAGVNALNASSSATPTPLNALPYDACGGALSALLSVPGPGARGLSVDPASGLRHNELFRVASDSRNSAVWYDIREERILVRDTRHGCARGRMMRADACALLCVFCFFRRRSIMLASRWAWWACCSSGRTPSPKTHTASSSMCAPSPPSVPMHRTHARVLTCAPCLLRLRSRGAQPIGKMVSLINMLAENPLRYGVRLERTFQNALIHSCALNQRLTLHPPPQRAGGDAHDGAQRGAGD
jgi:hypothetical protein